MKRKIFKKLSIVMLLLVFVGVGGIIINNKLDSNATPPYSFTSTNYVYMMLDARIPDEKAYEIKVVTFDHPDRLMNESYIEVYHPDGYLLKSQYFNGAGR